MRVAHRSAEVGDIPSKCHGDSASGSPVRCGVLRLPPTPGSLLGKLCSLHLVQKIPRAF